MPDKSSSIFTVSAELLLCSYYYSGKAPVSLARIWVDRQEFMILEKYIETIFYNLIKLTI